MLPSYSSGKLTCKQDDVLRALAAAGDDDPRPNFLQLSSHVEPADDLTCLASVIRSEYSRVGETQQPQQYHQHAIMLCLMPLCSGSTASQCPARITCIAC
jgi:hypothetical protein